MEEQAPAGAAGNGERAAHRDEGGLGSLGPEVQETLDELRGRIDAAAEQAARFVRARPATSLLMALGAGYLIGRLVRA